MDAARADALAARRHLGAHGWVPRDAEAFRHLVPPGAAVWLGEEGDAPATDDRDDGRVDGLVAVQAGCRAHPLAGAGWTLHPVGSSPRGRVDARWLDAGDAVQRRELFAGVPLPGQGEAAPFAWAHRALCRQGLRLRIGGAPDARSGRADTVWLQLRHQPRAAVEAPLLVIELLAGVHCVLVETHEREADEDRACRQPVVQNLHLQVRLGEGATLQHLRVATPGPDDRVAHVLRARLDRGARYDQALIASGSRYHLQRSEIELPAAQATARTAGLLLAADSMLEQQVQVRHDAACTTSAAEALALARGSARAVVQAHTRIAAGCDDAAVRQRLGGIPTGGQPKLVLRPHLEIHHDRVQAAHGATWGALPDEAVFYARQRGLDDDAARRLILEGQANALLARALGGPALPQALAMNALVAAALARHLAAAGPTGEAGG